MNIKIGDKVKYVGTGEEDEESNCMIVGKVYNVEGVKQRYNTLIKVLCECNELDYHHLSDFTIVSRKKLKTNLPRWF